MNNCNKCNEPIDKNLCSNCEQLTNLKIIDGQYIIREIADVFFAKKGLLYTVKNMLIRPGKSVRTYLREDRRAFMKPIMFVIITSLIYALVDHFFPFRFYVEARAANPDLAIFFTPFLIVSMGGDNAVFRWVADMSAYTTILLGLFIAFFVKLFFRKSGYNFFEFFVLLCYVCGISMLFLSITALLDFQTMGLGAMDISALISKIYLVWAVGQFFNENQRGIIKKTMPYIKGFLSLWLGVLIYAMLLTAIEALLTNNSVLDALQRLLQWYFGLRFMN